MVKEVLEMSSREVVLLWFICVLMLFSVAIAAFNSFLLVFILRTLSSE